MTKRHVYWAPALAPVLWMLTACGAGDCGGAAGAGAASGAQEVRDACFEALGVRCDAYEEAYLKASNTEGDFFGYSVALDGDRLAVGAMGEDSVARGVNGDQANNDAEGSGAVYVRRIAP